MHAVPVLRSGFATTPHRCALLLKVAAECLGHLPPSPIRRLEPLRQLRELKLYDNRLTGVAGLQYCTNLQVGFRLSLILNAMVPKPCCLSLLQRRAAAGSYIRHATQVHNISCIQTHNLLLQVLVLSGSRISGLARLRPALQLGSNALPAAYLRTVTHLSNAATGAGPVRQPHQQPVGPATADKLEVAAAGLQRSHEPGRPGAPAGPGGAAL